MAVLSWGDEDIWLAVLGRGVRIFGRARIIQVNYLASGFKKGDIYFNYGCFPRTWEDPDYSHPDVKVGGDNDPLDVLIFNHDPIDRGSLVQCRVLGVLDFVDNDEIDYKVIAVPHWSPKSRYPRLNCIEQEHLKIYKQFFRIYKIDRTSSVKVGEWKNGKKASTVVLDAHNRWLEKQKA